MNNLQKLSLDIMNNHSYEYIFANQYDVGRTVEITITDNDEPMDLRGVTALFSMLKPDGTYIANTCDVDGSVVTVTITEQMTVYPGKSNYQIVLEKDGNTISTIKGVFLVENAAVEDGTAMSGDESSMWSDIISRSDASKQYYDAIKGWFDAGSYDGSHGFVDLGEIYFSELPVSTQQDPVMVGTVYRIKDSFVSTSAFAGGEGITYPAGTNVYYSSANKWVCFAGVYSHKSDSETAPRNDALIWEQQYTPDIEPPQPTPIYNDNVFFSSTGYLGDVFYDHIIDKSLPVTLKKSSIKRGYPVSPDVLPYSTGVATRFVRSNTPAYLYLDFTLDENDHQVVYWWTETGTLSLSEAVAIEKLFTPSDYSSTGYSTRFDNIDVSGWPLSGHFTSRMFYYDDETEPTEDQIYNINVAGCTLDDFSPIFAEQFETPYQYLHVDGLNSINLLSNSVGGLLNGTQYYGNLDVSNWDLRDFHSSGYALLGGFSTYYPDRLIMDNWIVDDNLPMIYTGYGGTGYNIEDYSVRNWDLSNCTHLEAFAYYSGSIDGFYTWDTSSLTSMQCMFGYTNLDEDTLQSMSNWDVSNVENYDGIFGHIDPHFSNDFSFMDNWNIDTEASFENMFPYYDAGYPIIYPAWNGWFDYNSTYHPYEGSHSTITFKGMYDNLGGAYPQNPNNGDAYSSPSGYFFAYYDETTNKWYNEDDEVVYDPVIGAWDYYWDLTTSLYDAAQSTRFADPDNVNWVEGTGVRFQNGENTHISLPIDLTQPGVTLAIDFNNAQMYDNAGQYFISGDDTGYGHIGIEHPWCVTSHYTDTNETGYTDSYSLPISGSTYFQNSTLSITTYEDNENKVRWDIKKDDVLIDTTPAYMDSYPNKPFIPPDGSWEFYIDSFNTFEDVIITGVRIKNTQ